MRVLIGSIPAAGHFYPLVPLAWALRAAGHEVLVAVPADFVAEVTGAGLPAAACAGPLDSARIVAEMVRTPWHPDELARAGEVRAGDRGGFGALVAGTLDGTLALVRDWRPDLVVAEPAARAAQLAAARAGVPVVLHPWGMLVPSEMIPAATAVRRTIGPLERRLGLTEIPDPALVIDTCPPSYQFPDTLVAQRMRYVPYNGPAVVPDWAMHPAARRRVCVTLGSVLPDLDETGGLLDQLLAAFTGLGCELLVAIDDRAAAAAAVRAARPPGLLAAGRLPLDLVLPGCDLVVHHGGAGSVLTALVHGVPQVVVPRLADHFLNAGRIAALGAGVVVPPAEVSAAAVAQAVTAVLDDPAFLGCARGLAEEAAKQPPPAEVVAALEGLVGRTW